MNKKARMVAWYFFICGICSAQTVTLSPAPVKDDSFDNIKVIGEDEDGFFLLQSNLPLYHSRSRIGFKSRKYKVSYYNAGMVLRWSKPIESLPEESTVESVIFTNKNILITGSTEKNAEHKLSFYCQVMNNKGEIIKSKEAGNILLENNSSYDKVKLIRSADQQKTGLIIHEYYDEGRQAVHFLLIDNDLNLLKNKKLLINYDKKNFTATDYTLSNDGDFHLIGVQKIKNQKSKNTQEEFIIFSCADSSLSFTEHSLKEDNKNVTEAAISFDELNNQLVCLAFYADLSSTTGAGILYATLAMNESVLKIQSRPMNDNTNVQLLGQRNKGYEMDVISFPIEKIILRNDGGAVLLAEASYTTDFSYYDYFTQSFTRRVEYHFNNIVAISINGNGSVHWLNVIRKQQVSQEDGGIFSSFCPVLSSRELILIYNSSISKDAEVLSVHISNTGSQAEKTLSVKNSRMLIMPGNGKQISENEAIIPCISEKKLMLAKFTF